LRNKLIENSSPLPSKWVVLLDSDIYFDLSVFQGLFSVHPTKNGIGFLSAYSVQGFRVKNVRKQLKIDQEISDDQIITFGHYYDTFAFVDKDNQNYYPECRFDVCKQCTSTRTIKTTNQPFILVRSAFDGLAIIRTDILHNPKIKWNTINLFNKYSLCEHVCFCDAIHSATDYKVAIATSVRGKMYWLSG
jgi:hypothetical protein